MFLFVFSISGPQIFGAALGFVYLCGEFNIRVSFCLWNLLFIYMFIPNILC